MNASWQAKALWKMSWHLLKQLPHVGRRPADSGKAAVAGGFHRLIRHGVDRLLEPAPCSGFILRPGAGIGPDEF
jgi:hypothetical protein